MADRAASCVDHLFPHVPARQYVLSLPYALRFKMAYSPDATSMVLGAFISAINSDLRRRARKRKLRGRLRSGSLTVVQRFGSSLNLNVHFHVIAMDGVYAEQPHGALLFHPLPAPSNEDIARLARAVRMRFGEGRMALESTMLTTLPSMLGLNSARPRVAGQSRGAGGRRHLPRLGCMQLRQRSDSLCRWRTERGDLDRLPSKPSDRTSIQDSDEPRTIP